MRCLREVEQLATATWKNWKSCDGEVGKGKKEKLKMR